MGQIQTIDDLLNFLIRRRWLIIAIAAAGIIFSAVFAKTRPDTYEATAAIQVQGAQVGSAGASSGSAQMMQSIEQRLTTREAMLGVIERHGLYATLPLSNDDKVNALRGSVSFQAIESAGAQAYGQPAQISAILVSARDGTAENAARIANDFAQGVLDMSSAGQLERARTTFDFYHEEVERLTHEISTLETSIALYKNSHADALPTMAEARRDEMVNLDNDIRALDQQLVALMQEQRQLTGAGELRATERRRLQDLESQIAVLSSQKAALDSRRAALDAALAALPEVERGLSGMERELAQLQASLENVTARQAEAETAQRLAERQQGERFALLDRAVTPQYPLGSSGKKLFVAGALASIMGAIGLAFLLDLARPVVRSSAQMERQLGLRPVIAIPELDLGRGLRRNGLERAGGRLAETVRAAPPAVLIGSGLTLALLAVAALV